MATFIQAGEFLINLDVVAYVDLAPEPGVQVIHIYFNAQETDPDGSIAPHFVELSDEPAMVFLRDLSRIMNVHPAVEWMKGIAQGE